MLVYSHSHKDHIGGLRRIQDIKDLKIVALEGVSDFLKEMNDPNRLVPNVTFKSREDYQTWWQNSGAPRAITIIRQKATFSSTFPKPNF